MSERAGNRGKAEKKRKSKPGRKCLGTEVFGPFEKLWHRNNGCD